MGGTKNSAKHKKNGSLKKGGWKTAQTSGKQKKQTKLALIALAVFISTVLISQSIRFTNSLYSPQTHYTFSREYRFEGKSNLNLVIKGEEVSFFSFDFNEKKATLVKIPQETHLVIPGGYGMWPLRSVYALGQGEKVGKGAELLITSLSSMLGLPIDGIIEIKDPSVDNNTFIKNLNANVFLSVTNFSQIKTNLTTMEYIKLAKEVSQIRFDKIIELDLEDFKILGSQTLPDGRDVVVAEGMLLDNFIVDKLAESKFKEEALSVAIFNGTSQPGLAQKVSRLVTNMGGNVIISSNASSQDITMPVEQTFITSTSSKDSYTFKRLATVFVPHYDKILDVDFKTATRAQINLVLGNDYISRNP
jgi:hypothetical protein